MAKRRMLSAEIICSDKFLSMPDTARLLYMYLNASSDDDGFLSNPKSVCRASNLPAEALEILAENGYVQTFKSGVCVLVHWNVNNQIRKDRYQETFCTEEKAQLFQDARGVYYPKEQGAEAEEKMKKGARTKQKTPKDTGEMSGQNDEEKQNKKPFGSFQNVYLTEEEYEKLTSAFPNASDMIENLSMKLTMHGYHYKSHYATLLKWEQEDRKKAAINKASPDASNHTAYDFDAIEKRAMENLSFVDHVTM